MNDIKEVLRILKHDAFKSARARGFYPELDKCRGVKYHNTRELKACINPAPPLLQLYSEVGELVDAMRKPVLAQSKECESFYEFEIELADVLLTVASIAGATRARLAEAVLAKLEFNNNRQDRAEDRRF